MNAKVGPRRREICPIVFSRSALNIHALLYSVIQHLYITLIYIAIIILAHYLMSTNVVICRVGIEGDGGSGML